MIKKVSNTTNWWSNSNIFWAFSVSDFSFGYLSTKSSQNWRNLPSSLLAYGPHESGHVSPFWKMGQKTDSLKKSRNFTGVCLFTYRIWGLSGHSERMQCVLCNIKNGSFMIFFREKSQNGNACLGNGLGKCTLGSSNDFGCDLHCAEYDRLGMLENQKKHQAFSCTKVSRSSQNPQTKSKFYYCHLMFV